MTTEKIFKPGSQLALIEKSKRVPPLKIGKEEMKFEPEDLDDTYKEKALKELRETPENMKQALEEIKELTAGKKYFKHNFYS